MWITAPIILLSLFLFQKFLPFKAPNDYSLSTEKLNDMFAKKYILLLVITLAWIPLATFLFYSALKSLVVLQLGPDVWQVGTSADTWQFISLALGLSTAIVMLHVVVKLWFKENARLFWIFYNLKYKFEAVGLLTTLSLLLFVGGMVGTSLALDTYARFDDKGIVINNFFELKDHPYNYSDIESLHFSEFATAPNGNVVNKPNYQIHFSDNTVWSTDGHSASATSDLLLFNFLSRKSGKEIVYDE